MTVAIVTQIVVKSWILIGLPENRTADGAQPRIRALVPRPFSLLFGAGSGDETTTGEAHMVSLLHLLIII